MSRGVRGPCTESKHHKLTRLKEFTGQVIWKEPSSWSGYTWCNLTNMSVCWGYNALCDRSGFVIACENVVWPVRRADKSSIVHSHRLYKRRGLTFCRLSQIGNALHLQYNVCNGQNECAGAAVDCGSAACSVMRGFCTSDILDIHGQQTKRFTETGV